MSTDQFGVVGNHAGDSVVSPGALCWVCCVYGGSDQVGVRVRSRGGRWVRRDMAVWKLSNIRAKFLPPVDRKFRWEQAYPDRKEAEMAAFRLDKAAQAARARRNTREIERMAGLLDENGVRNDGRVGDAG